MKSGLKVTSFSLTTNSRNEPIADSSMELMTCNWISEKLDTAVLQDCTHILVQSSLLESVSEIKDIEEEGKDGLDHRRQVLSIRISQSQSQKMEESLHCLHRQTTI
jgi:hypothetical protein